MKTPEIPIIIIHSKLVDVGDSDDGKRVFITADSNDGWADLRLELDTDDCDQKHALAWKQRILACVNSCVGLRDLTAVSKLPRD